MKVPEGRRSGLYPMIRFQRSSETKYWSPRPSFLSNGHILIQKNVSIEQLLSWGADTPENADVVNQHTPGICR